MDTYCIQLIPEETAPSSGFTAPGILAPACRQLSPSFHQGRQQPHAQVYSGQAGQQQQQVDQGLHLQSPQGNVHARPCCTQRGLNRRVRHNLMGGGTAPYTSFLFKLSYSISTPSYEHMCCPFFIFLLANNPQPLSPGTKDFPTTTWS